MKIPRISEFDSPRRKIIAAAQGWRFAATRRRVAGTQRMDVPAASAGWLLFSDGRPALGVRQPHVTRQSQ